MQVNRHRPLDIPNLGWGPGMWFLRNTPRGSSLQGILGDPEILSKPWIFLRKWKLRPAQGQWLILGKSKSRVRLLIPSAVTVPRSFGSEKQASQAGSVCSPLASGGAVHCTHDNPSPTALQPACGWVYLSIKIGNEQAVQIMTAAPCPLSVDLFPVLRVRRASYSL